MSKLSSNLTLFFFFFLPFLGNSQTQSSEQAILLNIKQEWSNPPSISSWDSSTGIPYCNWTGVLCDDDNGSVNGISFRNFNITEKLPPSICDLKNLTVLDLSYNYLPGEFPTFLYNCSKLQYLDLSQNYFAGTIPSGIDRISTITFLDLGANNFSGNIPASIGNLPELEVLNIYSNQLITTFPSEVGKLSNLVELRLAYNGFVPAYIPSSFGGLKKLRHLWIAGSNLIGNIPESFANLTDLEYLDLSFNNLSGKIPTGLFWLKNLTDLHLFRNRLSGEIPAVIKSLKLIEIDLSINQLTGSIPVDFGKLLFLTHLFIYDNKLSGEIPASIGKLPSLVEIRLFINNLSGILPPELGLHSKLENLEVSQNQLSGNLPESLCTNEVFTGMIAFSNNLSGELPSSFANCSNLFSVQLYDNRFSGRIPYSFWSLKNLSTVMVSDNLFSGDLPDMLSWNLTRLELNNNQFSGRIPSKIVSSVNLRVFEASNNLFSGEIPAELTALPQLSTLLLDGNQLSGQIPAKIVSWASLTTLNLSRNQLSGEIPSTLGLLPDLTDLDLSQNQLTGGIPLEIGKLTLTFLNLSSNKLIGRIPFEFENLAFDRSFLNNSGLCTSDDRLRVSPCAYSSRNSRKKSSLVAIMLILTGAILLFIMLFAFFVIKDYQRRKHRRDLSLSWKLTSFQRLDFTEENIFSNLTPGNLIGSGGSGEIYRVAVNRSRNHVAVKKIWSKAKFDQNLEKEFLAEVEILGTIRHSNIVKLLCCISNEKSKFLVYEYIENRSLDRWLHKKKGASAVSMSVHHSALEWPLRMGIAVGAAQGLDYLHHSCSPPILHRDVKSSNILLDSEFNAKIADFGLARVLHKHDELNTMSVVAGSFGYIAPEYAHTNKVNEKIDVYSFGVVLLELVTGKEPNEGGEHTSLAEQSWRHFQDGNRIEDVLDEEVKEPSYLEEMCMVFKLGLMCTATLPSTRPSMKEVLQILLWRGPMQACDEKKSPNEKDVTPILDTTTDSYKSSQWKRKSDHEDDECGLACKV